MNPSEHPIYLEAKKEVSVARPIEAFAALGRNADAFLRRLQREGAEAQRLMAALERIDPQLHRPRIDYLRGILRHIQESATRPVPIFKAADGAFSKLKKGEVDYETFALYLQELEKRNIQPLISKVYERQHRNEIYQGHFVTSDRVEIRGGAQFINAIRLEFLRRLNEAMLCGGSFRKVWAHMDGDEVVWLYHHEEVAKGCCIYVRIEFRAIGRALIAEAEYYVPFGLEGDQANYQMETSDCYWRTGWKLTDVVQAGFSTSSTRSFTSSQTHGEMVNVTRGSGKSDGKASGTQSGGSFGRELGEWTRNWGNNSSNTDSESSHRDITTGTSQSDTASESNSDSEGRSLTKAKKAFGINMGLDYALHLKKWKAGNRDAARIFDDVQTFISSEMMELASWPGEGAVEVSRGDAPIAEYQKLIPIEAAGESVLGRKIICSGGVRAIEG